MQKKVFAIGFHKTATSSLGSALTILGYRVCGAVGVRDPDIQTNANSLIDEHVAHFDAFQDNPWAVQYQYLDNKYPDNLFILTVRDEKDWFASALAHFGSEDTPMRKWIYGVGHPAGNEAIYLARYQQHIRAVKQYFQNRKAQLLIMDITAGDAWSVLCDFLGKDIPTAKFPFENAMLQRLADD